MGCCVGQCGHWASAEFSGYKTRHLDYSGRASGPSNPSGPSEGQKLASSRLGRTEGAYKVFSLLV